MNDRRRVRPPVVAGTFYPGDPTALRRVVDEMLAHAHASRSALATSASARRGHPKAIVAPHAGFVYSGPIAASAYDAVVARRDEIRRVVLIGPSHRVPLRGLAVPSVDAFATPLGEIAIDDQARVHVTALPGVVVDDAPHADEHSLEVHLPFLQHILGENWEVLPILVGHAPAIEVADVLAAVWGGSETLIVVSTDLSHYHSYATAAELDQATAAAIVARDVDAIGPQDACGAYPLRGLLELSRRTGLDVSLLDLRSSGDTAGDRTRVVGYGAFAVR